MAYSLNQYKFLPVRFGGEFVCSYANKYSKNRMSVWSPYGFILSVRYPEPVFYSL